MSITFKSDKEEKRWFRIVETTIGLRDEGMYWLSAADEAINMADHITGAMRERAKTTKPGEHK